MRFVIRPSVMVTFNFYLCCRIRYNCTILFLVCALMWTPGHVRYSSGHVTCRRTLRCGSFPKWTRRPSGNCGRPRDRITWPNVRSINPFCDFRRISRDRCGGGGGVQSRDRFAIHRHAATTQRSRDVFIVTWSRHTTNTSNVLYWSRDVLVVTWSRSSIYLVKRIPHIKWSGDPYAPVVVFIVHWQNQHNPHVPVDKMDIVM